MGRARVKQERDVQFVEVGGKKIVLMAEKDYDQLLDALDVLEAERILADPKERYYTWDEVKSELIANRIAEIRKHKRVSQQELARRLKVKQSTVSRMEKKNANLTLATLRKVAKALGCSVHELLA